MSKELLKKILTYLLPAIIGSGITLKVSESLSVNCKPVINEVK